MRLYADIGLVKPEDPPDAIARTWARIVDSAGLHYFGVFVDGVLVSTCHVVIVPNITRAVRPYAVIENVGTLATHRRRGLGKLVMEAAIAKSWEAGCYKIMLATRITNERAQAFYRSLGFDPNAKQSFILSAR